MFTANNSPEVVSTYKRLLTSDWSASLPDVVLALLWDSLGGNGKHPNRESDSLWQLLDPNKSAAFSGDFFRSIVARIADGTKFVRVAGLPDLAATYVPPTTSIKLVTQANRLATYLTLPAHAKIGGDTVFFADVLALAFQAAIHFVLPKLRSRHGAEHALLLHSAVLFAVGYSAYQADHYAYMMSMVHGYLGDDNQRLQSLFASYRLTSPKDHSYLTKAQELWTELLDQDRFEEAESFLLSLSRWSLPSQQEEVREMIVDAFKYIVKNKRKKRARSFDWTTAPQSLSPFLL